MSDYFPPEIIEKILLKLPVESLIRFTAVSKSWRSIITSPSFISSHLYKPKTDTIIVRCYDEYWKKQKYYSLLEIPQTKPFTIICTKNFEIPLKWNAVDLGLVGSCRGVVCLSHYSSTRSRNSILLWNPRVRKHVVLPEQKIADQKEFLSEPGFGFANHDFKVVSLVFCYRPLYLHGAHVFSLKSWSWRKLEIDAKLRNFKYAQSTVFLNGFVYWLVRDPNFGHTILSFSVAQELFDEIKLPHELATMKNWSDLSMTLIGESLSVIKYPFNINGNSPEVWLMQGDGDESSWSRLYSFEMLKGMSVVFAIQKCSGEALVGTKENEFVALDFINSEIKNLGIRKISDFLYIENYVESLELLGGQSDSAQEFIEGVEEEMT